MVAEFPGQGYGGVDWLPDGSALVYSAIVDRFPQLFMVPSAGGAPRPLTREAANLFHP
jgi:hypothetical protein